MTATNQTTTQILNYLYDLKIYAWRQNTSGIPMSDGKFRPAAKTGLSDILAILPPVGRFLAIEIKTGSDRLRPEQEGFLKNVQRAGGFALVVVSFDDFVDKLNSLDI